METLNAFIFAIIGSTRAEGEGCENCTCIFQGWGPKGVLIIRKMIYNQIPK